MDFIKIRFGSNFDKLSSKFDKTIEEMFQSMNPIFSLSESLWRPQMDICETPEEIVIMAEMAGVEKENLELEINTKAVKIFGNRASVPPVKNARYRLAEIQYGRFERVLFLPAPIDTDRVSATYLNGLLQIRMAKIPLNTTHVITIEEG